MSTVGPVCAVVIDDSACPGCQVRLSAVDGPVHRYMTSTAACWGKYGELLAREYSDENYMAVHRYTVDSYAVQHPGDQSPQAVQSVAVHLTALCAALEYNWPLSRISSLLKRLANNGKFHWLSPPSSPGALTVLHPLSANNAQEHGEKVTQWAQASWAAWGAHHAQVRSWFNMHK